MLIHAILALSPLAVAGLVAAFILGGTAKGALGIGLPLVAVPLTVLAQIHQCHDQPDLAFRYYHEALEVARETGERVAKALLDS